MARNKYVLTADAVNDLSTMGFPSITNIKKIALMNNKPVDFQFDTSMNSDPLISSGKVFYNWIVYGAPGTGKSFTLNKALNEKNIDTSERVTFFPEYSHAMFFGNYKPFDDGQKLTYTFVPGPFLRVWVNALQNQDKFHVLIIEELNRANAAAVFGDLLQVLDRDENGVSKYAISLSDDVKRFLARPDVLGGEYTDFEELRLPNNMLIWCTMNNADQGVYPLDTAFKRRWHYTYKKINYGRTKYLFKHSAHPDKLDWTKIRKAINDALAIECHVNEDKLLGDYFLDAQTIATKSSEIIDQARFLTEFKEKVLMYLFEDAGKRCREDLFNGCTNYNSFSSVIETFEKKGLAVFGSKAQNSIFFRYYK